MKFGAPFLGAFATCDPIALRDYVQAVEGLGYSHLIAVMVFGRIAGRLCTGNPITNADSHSAAAYCGPRTDPEAGSDLRESGLPLQRARGSTGRVRPRRRAGGSQQPVDQPAHEGYVDVAGLIQTLPDDIPAGWLVEYTDEATAQAALDAGEVAGYYVISPDYVQTGNMTYVTEEHNIPTALAVWSLVYFLLGYAMYGAQLAGIGALAPDAKETRTANLLVMSPLTIGYMFNIAIIANPDGPAALALSLFPLTSPISMIARMSITEVPFWQPALAAVLQLLTAVLIVHLVARLFRAQYLLSGQPFSIRGYYGALVGRA